MRMEDEEGAAAVAEFVQILDEHRKTCEREGKYIEADIAKKRLEELRQHEDNRKQEGLRSRQIAQRLGVEEAHMLEFQQFNSMWDNKMKEYEQRAGELLEAMRQRHVLDLREFHKKKEEGPGMRPKHSKDLLDLRKIQVTLAKQGDYTEAQKVKVQGDGLEATEVERARQEREQQALGTEGKLLHRQEQELKALRKRITTGAEEQRQARQQDLERLLQRYHNVKSELESQQNTERIRSSKVGSSLGVLGNYGNSGLGASASRVSGLGNRQPSSARRGGGGGRAATVAKLDW